MEKELWEALKAFHVKLGVIYARLEGNDILYEDGGMVIYRIIYRHGTQFRLLDEGGEVAGVKTCCHFCETHGNKACWKKIGTLNCTRPARHDDECVACDRDTHDIIWCMHVF
jgi:hypothetical protein